MHLSTVTQLDKRGAKQKLKNIQIFKNILYLTIALYWIIVTSKSTLLQKSILPK